jgi:hypothetical protein
LDQRKPGELGHQLNLGKKIIRYPENAEWNKIARIPIRKYF